MRLRLRIPGRGVQPVIAARTGTSRDQQSRDEKVGSRYCSRARREDTPCEMAHRVVGEVCTIPNMSRAQSADNGQFEGDGGGFLALRSVLDGRQQRFFEFFEACEQVRVVDPALGHDGR